MKQLTEREEEVMNFFWESGALSVRDVVALRRYFDNSIQNVVNFLINSEEYSDEEAKEIISQISNRGKE